MTALHASQHLTKLGSKKLLEFITQTGPIEIPKRYGDDALMGLCRIVIGQQLSGHAAHSIWARIESLYPDRHHRIQAFASPNTHIAGVSNAKKKTLQAIAFLGDSWVERIKDSPPEARHDGLIAVKGIGPWSIAMWSMFVLGEADCWSDGDLILKRASAQLTEGLGIDRRAWIACAAPYRTYLALYLWAMKDQGWLTDVPVS